MQVRPGGLMRCCLQSLKTYTMTGSTQPPLEGERLRCAYCSNVGGGMVFRDGAWEWANDPLSRLQ